VKNALIGENNGEFSLGKNKFRPENLGFGLEELEYALQKLIIEIDRYRFYYEDDYNLTSQSQKVLARYLESVKKEIKRNDAFEFMSSVFLTKNEIDGDDDLTSLPSNSSSSAQHSSTVFSKKVHDLRSRFFVLFSQLCSTIQAKSVEDTVFYRYVSLLSLNEVGGDPSSLSFGIGDFHDYFMKLSKRSKLTVVTSTTHDTKRSEDTRAQISVIADNAEEWEVIRSSAKKIIDKKVSGFNPTDLTATTLNEPYITFEPTTLDETHFALETATLDILLQTIFGTITSDVPISEISGIDDLKVISSKRLTQYIIKALKEQKLATSWAHPNVEYEKSVIALIEALLSDLDFVTLFKDFYLLHLEEIVNKVLLLKAITLMTVGVSDLYQGSESSVFTLVDPDNREPVDYVSLEKMFDNVKNLGSSNDDVMLLSGGAPSLTLSELKLYLTHKLLGVRNEYKGAFCSSESGYLPIKVNSSSNNMLAFARTEESGESGAKSNEIKVIVLAKLFKDESVTYLSNADLDLLDVDASVVSTPVEETKATIDIPQNGCFKSVFTGRIYKAGEYSLGQFFRQTAIDVLVAIDLQ
jgi:(1->4)-alpha-D-glucan 1-alpha-D-glucosylmutase